MADGLAAEDLDHLVAVAAALGLEVLPLLGTLVDAHILDREGADGEGAGAALGLLLALNIVALVALDVVRLRLFRRAGLTVELNKALAGEVDGIFAVVDANPAAAEAFGSFTGGAGAHEAVEDETAPRTGNRDNPLQQRNGLLSGIPEPFQRHWIHWSDIVPKVLYGHALLLIKKAPPLQPLSLVCRKIDAALGIHLLHGLGRDRPAVRRRREPLVWVS